MLCYWEQDENQYGYTGGKAKRHNTKSQKRLDILKECFYNMHH